MEPLLDALRVPYRIVRDAGQIERAITDAFDWSYAAYHHSAIVLGGDLVR
jgi:sulfopyruvate decarboxylase subunit alpha